MVVLGRGNNGIQEGNCVEQGRIVKVKYIKSAGEQFSSYR